VRGEDQGNSCSSRSSSQIPLISHLHSVVHGRMTRLRRSSASLHLSDGFARTVIKRASSSVQEDISRLTRSLQDFAKNSPLNMPTAGGTFCEVESCTEGRQWRVWCNVSVLKTNHLFSPRFQLFDRSELFSLLRPFFREPDYFKAQ
jgi:hypothetical protein